MKAVLSKAIGGPETLVLEEVADPVASPGQVVVRVKAAGVNYPDALIIEDRYQFKAERPFSPGGEFSGIVESVGEGVSSLRVGMRVLGFSIWGAMAQKIAVSADHCLPIPDAMSFSDGAAFILTYGTAYHALRDRARLAPGETLLVLGAAGGVGLSCVQIGKAMDARVVAAVSSDEKADLVRRHGADNVVVYPLAPFAPGARDSAIRAFKDISGSNGADVVCDVVGGDYSEAALRAIAWEGRFLILGFPSGIPHLPLNLPLLKGCQLIGVFWSAWLNRNVEEFRRGVAALLRWYSEGKVRPFISHSFPFDQAGAAINHLAARKSLGKIVVDID